MAAPARTCCLSTGSGADKDNWDRFAKRLTGSYRVIAPDVPGFGDSSKIPGAKYDMQTQVMRVHEFVRAIGLKKFHIAGNSMGGLIAGMYAASYPEDVLTLGLFDAGRGEGPGGKRDHPRVRGQPEPPGVENDGGI